MPLSLRPFTKIVVVAEGLLIYFAAAEVAASLAKDLASGRTFMAGFIDLASPGQLKLTQRTTGKQLVRPMRRSNFGPREGPDFFLQHGWEPKDVQGRELRSHSVHKSAGNMQ